MTHFRLVNFVVGALAVALAVPLIRGRVAPNGVYGLRTPETLADPAVWYPANRRSGWDLVAFGAAVMVWAAAGPALVPAVRGDRFVHLTAAGTVGLLLAVAARGWLHGRRLWRAGHGAARPPAP
jgi:hypothetical protein